VLAGIYSRGLGRVKDYCRFADCQLPIGSPFNRQSTFGNRQSAFRNVLLIKLPTRLEIPCQFLLRKTSPHKFNWNSVFPEHCIIKDPVSHLACLHQLAMHSVDLQSPNQIGDLLERSVASIERAPDFRCCVVSFMADPVDE